MTHRQCNNVRKTITLSLILLYERVKIYPSCMNMHKVKISMNNYRYVTLLNKLHDPIKFKSQYGFYSNPVCFSLIFWILKNCDSDARKSYSNLEITYMLYCHTDLRSCVMLLLRSVCYTPYRVVRQGKQLLYS